MRDGHRRRRWRIGRWERRGNGKAEKERLILVDFDGERILIDENPARNQRKLLVFGCRDLDIYLDVCVQKRD